MRNLSQHFRQLNLDVVFVENKARNIPFVDVGTPSNTLGTNITRLFSNTILRDNTLSLV